MKMRVLIVSFLAAVILTGCSFLLILTIFPFTEDIEIITPDIAIESDEGIEFFVDDVELVSVRNNIAYRKSCIINARIRNKTGEPLDAAKSEIKGFDDDKEIFSMTVDNWLDEAIDNDGFDFGIEISEPFRHETINYITIKVHR